MAAKKPSLIVDVLAGPSEDDADDAPPSSLSDEAPPSPREDPEAQIAGIQRQLDRLANTLRSR